MKIGRSARAIVVVSILAVVCAACGNTTEPQTLTPLIAPPLIAEEGVLRAGVDLDYPPFAGTDNGVQAGIDVDIAAAIAERLGLRVKLVDVKQSEIATALSDGTVDIMLGATPITQAVLANVSTAGSYLIDGPAMYSMNASGSVAATASAAATLSPDALGDLRVAAQNSSESYWQLEMNYGEGFTQSYSTLREAFDALDAGDVDVVVGDAAVCAYIARDYEGAAYVGQYAPGEPIGIAVKKDATELEEQVRTTLDTLAAEGVLAAIKSKWLGEFPVLQPANK